MNEQRNLFLAIVLMMAVLFGWQYFVAVPRMQEEQAKLADKQKTEMPALTPGRRHASGCAERRDAGRSARAVADARRDRNPDGRRLGQPDRRALRRSASAQISRDARPKKPGDRAALPGRGRAPLFRGVRLDRRAKAKPRRCPNAETMWQLAEGSTLSPGNDIDLTYDNGQGLTFTRRIAVDDKYMFTVADTREQHQRQRRSRFSPTAW